MLYYNRTIHRVHIVCTKTSFFYILYIFCRRQNTENLEISNVGLLRITTAVTMMCKYCDTISGSAIHSRSQFLKGIKFVSSVIYYPRILIYNLLLILISKQALLGHRTGISTSILYIKSHFRLNLQWTKGYL
jgi:hypothetical protein